MFPGSLCLWTEILDLESDDKEAASTFPLADVPFVSISIVAFRLCSSQVHALWIYNLGIMLEILD